jgi:hypothetical protein
MNQPHQSEESRNNEASRLSDCSSQQVGRVGRSLEPRENQVTVRQILRNHPQHRINGGKSGREIVDHHKQQRKHHITVHLLHLERPSHESLIQLFLSHKMVLGGIFQTSLELHSNQVSLLLGVDEFQIEEKAEHWLDDYFRKKIIVAFF